MSDTGGNDPFQKFVKAALTGMVVVTAFIVVVFGLLVGVCGLGM